jgi:hypothetical protein
MKKEDEEEEEEEEEEECVCVFRKGWFTCLACTQTCTTNFSS